MSFLGDDFYRLFFEESNDALWVIRLKDLKILAVNPAVNTYLGFSQEELIDEALSLVSFSQEYEEGQRERFFVPSMLESEGFYNDVALRCRDSSLRFFTLKVKHIEYQNQPHALMVMNDDTERQLLLRDVMTKHQEMENAYVELAEVHEKLKNTQDKMAQASKLLALGELAAGISHELNQPLTGIRGFSQEIVDVLNSEKAPSKKNIKSLANEILKNSDKMASLLSHLRTFARQEKKNLNQKRVQKIEPVSLNEAFTNVKRLFERQLINKNIQFKLSGLKGEMRVLGDLQPIEQILINLISNARDALDVKSAEESKCINISVENHKDEIWIHVEDTGRGIPLSNKNRIFDPFFTTKDVNKGLGLGLSISYSLAQELGGDLSLEDSSSLGTKFLLRLKNSHSNSTKEAA